MNKFDLTSPGPRISGRRRHGAWIAEARELLRLAIPLAGASYWLAGAPMCALLGFGLGLEGFGIWLGLAFGLFVAGVLLTGRFILLSQRPVAVK